MKKVSRAKKLKTPLLNNSGFIAADFIFSFVLVISSGIIIFALTFSLATVEIAQYITWSAARAYSAANLTKAASEAAGNIKFRNLSLQYPLLTGSSGESSWFALTRQAVGDTAYTGLSGPVDTANKSSAGGAESRHPWTGVSAELELKLFKSLQIPFLGKIAEAGSDTFIFPIRAFLLRNPSQQECLNFFKKENRFEQGIKKLENWDASPGLGEANAYVAIEDNGC